MKMLSRGLLAAACASALVTADASAAVSVNLRIEGPNRTVFEGPVGTDLRPFTFTDDPTEYPCDATGANNGGPSPAPQVNRGNALDTASEQAGFSLRGRWFDGFGPSFSEVGGENVAYNADTRAYLVEYKNYRFAEYGSCGDPIAAGDDLLFAYGNGSEPLLRLTGPAIARPSQPFDVDVVDGKDGAAVEGASVGGATTNTAGDARVTLTERGPNVLKATKPGTIRSNAVTVCVTDGADGFCGTTKPDGTTAGGGGAAATTGAAPFAAPDRTAPTSLIVSVREGQVFSRSRAPRLLRGQAGEPVGGARALRPDPSGLLMVKLRLTRTDRGRCSTFSSSRERFVRRPCGAARGYWFRIGDRAAWEYQLPARLPRGRYVLDVNAIDRAFNRDDVRKRGVNRVVFRVR